MDVVEFAEKYMNIQLFEYQKQFLRDLENLRSDGDIKIIRGRDGRIYIYPDKRIQRELINRG